MKGKLLILVLFCGLIAAREQIGAANKADVVLRWAPVIYQQDDGRNPVARENVFTEVNFDHDWRLNNNSLNLPYYSPSMAAYYSLVESDKHYFIGYYFYYPRHAGTDPHEHDMIGTVAAVRKDPKGSGRLDMLMTYSHKRWQKWDNSQVGLENGRPVFAVSAGTHKITAIRPVERTTAVTRVYPVITKVLSSPISGQVNRIASHANYRLVDLNELWQRRNDIGQGRTFSRRGYFDSDSYQNAAAPWAWKYEQMNWLTKPAEVMKRALGTPAEPEMYVTNPYIIKIYDMKDL